MKILAVVGARPNFMKIAPIFRAFDDVIARDPEKNIRHALVHTGQHYDDNMSKVFFDDLDIPRPDINLDVGSGTHSEQTAAIMVKFERFCEKEKPDLIMVVGDVNSTLACSIVAAKLLIPVVHVEAGLRSFDRTMPEEINRVVTDALSEHLFTTSPEAAENLKKEGISGDKIHFVGNVMIDTLFYSLPKTKNSVIKTELGLNDEPFALVTLHRPSNVDTEKIFGDILDGLMEMSKKITVIFPIHPRARKKIEGLNAGDKIKDNGKMRLIDPVGYLDFLTLMKSAALVLTASGGIQEETTVLGVPCLTLRENTERPVTITEGTNILVGTDTERIVSEADRILRGEVKTGKMPELWDGKTAERIVAKIIDIYC